MSKRERRARKQKAWRQEAKQREVFVLKSSKVPARKTSTKRASKELVEQFDGMLASMGEPKDRLFPSLESLDSTVGAFTGMGDCEAEVGGLLHEWLWKMRHAEEPVVIRGNHGLAVGYTFKIQTESGSYSTDFGLYVDPDADVTLGANCITACLSWSRSFQSAYPLAQRIRLAHMPMFMRLLNAHGLHLKNEVA